ncbi:MAG: STAS domain-containing protein [Anaerolineales bacterium]|nr:STAS domain-containing protein [Anaerolineales bacterium]
MDITVKQAQGRVPVTILQTHGDLDASSFQTLINKGKEVYDTGTRNILLDMSGTAFMGSSGLAALHSLALLLRGDELPDLEGAGTFSIVLTATAALGCSSISNYSTRSPKSRRCWKCRD